MSSRDTLPIPVRRALRKLGGDLRVARLKRGLTTDMMAERIGITRPTFRKVEHGDPGVGIGVYATALMVLGFGTPLADLADQRRDDAGLLLDLERVPQRARPRKQPRSL